MSDPLIIGRHLVKHYPQGSSKLEVLKGLDLTIIKGDAVCIRGSSGAGKSTLLHILGTLDKPTSGDLYYRDQNLFKKRDDELALFRNKKMGFVFKNAAQRWR